MEGWCLPTPYLPATHLPTSSHRSSSPKIRLAMVWFTLILSRCRSAAVRPGRELSNLVKLRLVWVRVRAS